MLSIVAEYRLSLGMTRYEVSNGWMYRAVKIRSIEIYLFDRDEEAFSAVRRRGQFPPAGRSYSRFLPARFLTPQGDVPACLSKKADVYDRYLLDFLQN